MWYYSNNIGDEIYLVQNKYKFRLIRKTNKNLA